MTPISQTTVNHLLFVAFACIPISYAAGYFHRHLKGLNQLLKPRKRFTASEPALLPEWDYAVKHGRN